MSRRWNILQYREIFIMMGSRIKRFCLCNMCLYLIRTSSWRSNIYFKKNIRQHCMYVMHSWRRCVTYWFASLGIFNMINLHAMKKFRSLLIQPHAPLLTIWCRSQSNFQQYFNANNTSVCNLWFISFHN